ncbi:hypothetical protein HAL011_02550 [Helicobacter ailurogastricus]|uniref:Uncharacterized protein n=1 Tax=Helicobacter ailurogastricus TaxID=1578720 RepID=A0A0K2X3T6_9HELI|nr:hypothetical protein HAL011_02550 [Helicobacter ailurogastricus]
MPKRRGGSFYDDYKKFKALTRLLKSLWRFLKKH